MSKSLVERLMPNNVPGTVSCCRCMHPHTENRAKWHFRMCLKTLSRTDLRREEASDLQPSEGLLVLAGQAEDDLRHDALLEVVVVGGEQERQHLVWLDATEKWKIVKIVVEDDGGQRKDAEWSSR